MHGPARSPSAYIPVPSWRNNDGKNKGEIVLQDENKSDFLELIIAD